MPEETPKETPSPQGSEGAAATEAYMQALVPGSASQADETKPPPADDKPERKYAGKYETVEKLEEGYKNSQREYSKAEPLIKRAQRFQNLLDAAESNPDGVLALLHTLSGESPGETTQDDDYMTKAEATKLIRQVETQAEQRASYEQQLAALKAKHSLTEEQVAEFLDGISTRKVTLDDLYTLGNLDTTRAEAANAGRQEVVDRVREAGKKAPPIGAIHGTADAEKSMEEQMADEIVGADSKKRELRELLGG